MTVNLGACLCVMGTQAVLDREASKMVKNGETGVIEEKKHN